MRQRAEKTTAYAASSTRTEELRAAQAIASNNEAGVDAGEELDLGLAADREERARKLHWVNRRLERVRRWERWGGRLLSFGGVLFYALFLIFPLAGFVFHVDLPPLSWKLAFGMVIAAIIGGGVLVFLSQRAEAWLEHWARANSIDV